MAVAESFAVVAGCCSLMFRALAGMYFEIESLENVHLAAIDSSGAVVASVGRNFVAKLHGS